MQTKYKLEKIPVSIFSIYSLKMIRLFDYLII